MLLSAVSVLVDVQSSSEIPEGLMNNPVEHSPTEIQTQTHCNVISPSITALLPVLLPSCVFLLPSTDCPFIHTTKNLDHILKRLVFQFLNFFELWI